MYLEPGDLSSLISPGVSSALTTLGVTFCRAVRHPASGYVQGINDLLTPFLTVFLSERFDCPMESWSLEKLSEDDLLDIEADSYWCLSKLLDSIQDHYTFAQPGIQRLVFRLKELVRRIDGKALYQICSN